MASISETIGIISLGVVLCLGLFNVAEAGERKSIDIGAEKRDEQPNTVKCDKERQQGIHTIRGEVVHINGERLLVTQANGEEAISTSISVPG